MRYDPKLALSFAAGAAVLLASCSDRPILEPVAGLGSPAYTQTTEVCETLDFNQFAHGDILTSVTALGMTLTIESYVWAQLDRPSIVARTRAYDTNNIDGPDPDLEWQGTNPQCPGCQGQGRVATLEDIRGWEQEGDERAGGRITFTGFTAPVFVKSWKAIDNDLTEDPFLLEIDDGAGGWLLLSQSTPLGNGSVQQVNSPYQALFNNALRFTFGRAETRTTKPGSGSIDDLVICQVREVPGNEGCTLGYWKTHSDQAPGNQQDAWIPTGYKTSTLVSAVFNVPAGLTDLNGDGKLDTLYDALGYGGGAGVAGGARVLLKQAVAALLNASHPDVSYPLTSAQVIAQVNAALASGNRNTMIALGEQLDKYNNEGCPLN